MIKGEPKKMSRRHRENEKLRVFLRKFIIESKIKIISSHELIELINEQITIQSDFGTRRMISLLRDIGILKETKQKQNNIEHYTLLTFKDNLM